MTGTRSFLGADYTRFEDVTVRLRSIGSRVVLQMPPGSTNPKFIGKFIGVPKERIEVE